MDAINLFARNAIGYVFKNPAHLRDALTHPSARREEWAATPSAPSAFERLEYLGDGVLGLVITEDLMRRFPNEKEGELSRRQAALVSRDVCRSVGRDIGLDKIIDAQMTDDWTTRTSAVCDAMEAVVGAVFLDAGGGGAGYDACAPIVRRLWKKYIEAMVIPPRDPKTALQEWAQRRKMPLPKYTLAAREGNDHEPVFAVTVTVADRQCLGRGNTIKSAEKAAATAAMANLDHH